MEAHRGSVVRWLAGPRWRSPLPIWAGDPGAPIEPEWALIARFRESRWGPETFALEFMDNEDQVLAHFQFETLEIAIDQAFDIAGIDRRDWVICDVVLPTEGDYPSRTALEAAG